jgi:hypothetical protein
VTTRTRKLLIWSSVLALGALYLSGPIVAGVFGIGNRVGPKIYPEALHDPLYRIAWALSSHPEGKPRLPYVFRSEYRPWFYGMYSKNDDPVWLKGEFERRQRERDAATRPTE